MRLDHAFILCAAEAPEAVELSRLGWKEGTANTHPGQGTACRRFFFRNAYLELLWVCDEREARSEPVRRTQLWERWSQRGRGACPFGIVLRPAVDAPGEGAPFPTWAYAPGYLPAGCAIDVAVDPPLNEPALFYLGFQRGRPGGEREPAAHTIAPAEITGVRIGIPGSGPQSTAARAVEAAGVISFTASSEYVLGLTLDGAIAGKTADLRPRLPLVTHW